MSEVAMADLYRIARVSVVSAITSELGHAPLACIQKGAPNQRFVSNLVTGLRSQGVDVLDVAVDSDRVRVTSLIDGIKHTSIITASDVLDQLPSLRNSRQTISVREGSSSGKGIV